MKKYHQIEYNVNKKSVIFFNNGQKKQLKTHR
jgi:hypothetical protein